MAYASGWKPGMTDAVAIQLIPPNDLIGYAKGGNHILGRATEQEAIECVKAALRSAKDESKV